jgi:hypothetical protein
MDDEPPKIEPEPTDPAGLPESRFTYPARPPGAPGDTKPKSGCGALILGGFLCVLLLCMLGATGNVALCLVATPLVGLALIVIKGTRGVGLGVLIVYGILWLAFLAICGGRGVRM